MRSQSDSQHKQCAGFGILPFHHFPVNPQWHIPTREECIALWDKYSMPEHIRAHSEQVAHVAAAMAVLANDRGQNISVESVTASALLHDIAKAYTIEFGGDHAWIGGSIVLSETGNPYVAQGVMHHVQWDWPVDSELCFLPLAIIYADKRVMHDSVVSLDERFEDLVVRYGRTDRIIDYIMKAKVLAQEIELAFSEQLGISLHEYSFDSGRVV
ncbi:YfbR-like 5'-deoxynucleotidase [Halodesulfovibrio spirochaetisodalis]|uniref:Phosphohydrolase n=1 Tax=Halodesulfovibrio spirochaetisodalis TaxID=1560234 RepID=A0A1B7X8S5_9BACT|nr:YfbR-like 5'-deoxynucleotidase [Halodesulfovibrio spirochaetisodalis]OBQ45774.1 phosphohydrolase [Halodesulfovibrio spirochaetisodalis]